MVFNLPPTIVGISADPAQLSSQGPTAGMLRVLAIDAENDPLHVAWSADPDSPCAVVFGSPTQANTSFTAMPAGIAADHCTFVVTVDDGVWPGTTFKRDWSVAKLTLAMTAPVEALLPPKLGIGYQSDDAAVPGGTVMFGAVAADPADGELSYTWSASSGPAPLPADPAELRLDPVFTAAATWTVPDEAALPGPSVVGVSATSCATGLAATTTFLLAQPAP